MATLTFSFDTGAVPVNRIVEAFADAYHYKDMIPSIPGDPTSPLIPNPETKSQFARRMVKLYIVSIVKGQDVHVAVTAAESSITSIDLT